MGGHTSVENDLMSQFNGSGFKNKGEMVTFDVVSIFHSLFVCLLFISPFTGLGIGNIRLAV
jgi:hypothetical protein